MSAHKKPGHNPGLMRFARSVMDVILSGLPKNRYPILGLALWLLILLFLLTYYYVLIGYK